MMRRGALLGLILCLSVLINPVSAAVPQNLPQITHKFYPLRDLVMVDFYNPYFAPIDNIIVNMIVREGTGQNRIIAIGQERLPANLVLKPGERSSTRIPIRARIVREIPALAQFEFRVIGRQIEEKDAPPQVVVLDSPTGSTLEVTEDANRVPYVMGFLGLHASTPKDTNVTVERAILTFFDENHQILWSEQLPINGTLTNVNSLMIWAKYEQANSYVVPGIKSVEVKFVTAAKAQQ